MNKQTIKELIIDLLRELDRPISPLETFQILKKANPKRKLNRSSIRTICSTLHKQGIINRPYHGHYSIKASYGIGKRELPRIQNLHIVASKVEIREIDRTLGRRKWDWNPFPEEKGLRVLITFGWNNKKISWTVRAPQGLSLYGLRLVRKLVEVECKRRGYRDLKWICVNHEKFSDIMGVRIEGAKVITLDNLEGTLEKIYNKAYGVRHEVRVNQPISMESLEALWHGGVSTYQVQQSLWGMSNDIRKMVEFNKSMMGQYADSNRIQRAIFGTFTSMVDRLGDLDERVKGNAGLGEKVDELVVTMKLLLEKIGDKL